MPRHSPMIIYYALSKYDILMLEIIEIISLSSDLIWNCFHVGAQHTLCGIYYWSCDSYINKGVQIQFSPFRLDFSS